MADRLGRVVDALAREPVLLVGAATAWIATLEPSPLTMAAVVATGTWVARLASKSKRTAAEDVEVARYVGAVEATQGHGGPGGPH